MSPCQTNEKTLPLLPSDGLAEAKQQARSGRPLAKTDFSGDAQEKFWKTVEIKEVNECWPWRGSKNPNGYGQLRVSGKTQMAHRMAMALSGTPIPPGMFACHHCDNPPCCNPDHLFLGSAKDNALDASSKKRCTQQRKTHCPKGHPYESNSGMVTKRGWRLCRICDIARKRAYRRKNKLNKKLMDHERIHELEGLLTTARAERDARKIERDALHETTIKYQTRLQAVQAERDAAVKEKTEVEVIHAATLNALEQARQEAAELRGEMERLKNTDLLVMELQAATAQLAAADEMAEALRLTTKFLTDEVYRSHNDPEAPPEPADELSYKAVGHIQANNVSLAAYQAARAQGGAGV